jgi:transposase-like protein
VEEALEAEVAEAVGRGYYENGAAPGAGYRNGYRRGRLSTAEGAIEYGVPQVADRPEPFVSRVRAGLAGRTAELERLAVEIFARGLSTRDIEAAFRDATGSSTLSRPAVSQVTERLWQEYEAFATRDLSEFAIAYLFVDGVAERLHAGLPREAVLCAWGITDDGQKSCRTWPRARMRTRRAARPSSRISSRVVRSSGCFSKSAGGRRSSRTRSASGRC